MDLNDVKKRQDAEKIFHDNKLTSKKRRKNYYDLGFKSIMFTNMMSKLEDIENKKILEIGCGNGWLTRNLASRGAEVWTFDISDEAVKNTKALMKSHNLQDRVHVDQMAAENLNYDTDMFDIVVGMAILHHIDLDLWIKEIKRVLKDHGKGYFLEPLGHNPFLNLFRVLTPNIRSKDEVPMRFEQFPVIQDAFSKFEHEEYYLTSLFALFWYFIGMNKLMLKTRDVLFKLDETILKAFPGMGKYCWYSMLMIEK